MVAEYRLLAPKGVLLYLPPGCGKTGRSERGPRREDDRHGAVRDVAVWCGGDVTAWADGEQVAVRPVVVGDVDTLWTMLYWAAHVDEQDGVEPAAIRSDPALSRYVAGWGRDGDVGVVASTSDGPVGAAWLRLFAPSAHVDETFVASDVPELAVATVPAAVGHGIGSAMLDRLLAAADDLFPAVVLTVRSDNPADRLYRRFGFVEVGRIVNRVGTESLKMVRPRNAPGPFEV